MSELQRERESKPKISIWQILSARSHHAETSKWCGHTNQVAKWLEIQVTSDFISLAYTTRWRLSGLNFWLELSEAKFFVQLRAMPSGRTKMRIQNFKPPVAVDYVFCRHSLKPILFLWGFLCARDSLRASQLENSNLSIASTVAVHTTSIRNADQTIQFPESRNSLHDYGSEISETKLVN